MLSVDYLTTDARLIDLAKAYWMRNSAGQWEFKLPQLEEKFDIRKGKVLQQVSAICHARARDVLCQKCHQQIPVRSRSDFDSLVREQHQQYPGYTPSRLICTDCHADEFRRQKAAAVAAAQAKEQAIRDWLSNPQRALPTRTYASMNLREAFLLDGLLRYAGDAWRNERLDPWERNQPKLCDLDADIRTVLQELYEGGWLAPSTDSPLDAFSVEQTGRISVDVLRVGWTIATDSTGHPHSALIDVAQAVQEQASAADYRAIWEWVCLCELRAHYAYSQCRHKLHKPDWTPALERSLILLLAECPLGTAKTVMWGCVKDLIVELQKRVRPAMHNYAMFPGNLQRRFDHWRARGWSIEPWRPLSRSIYSQHLFDRAMGGGEECYDTITGNDLQRQGRLSTAAEAQTAQGE